MTPQGETYRLSERFVALLHRLGQRQADVSEELGFHAGYLGRAFRGEVPFKLELAFALLAHLRIDPEDFFCGLYPFGGPVTEDLRTRRPAPYYAGWAEASRLRTRDAPTGRPESAREWVLRAGEVLRLLMRRRHVKQAEASRALGLGGAALGHALRGAAGLTLGQVFGVLELCGASPGRFFLEVFRPNDNPLAGLLWAEQLDILDAGWQTSTEEVAGKAGKRPATRR